MPNDPHLLIKANSIVTGYGKKQIIKDVTLTVARGEIVTLIGHNGAGKSTLLKALFGLIPLWKGEIVFEGESVRSPSPRLWLRKGLAYVPQGNRVFGNLTVQENLIIGGAMLNKAQISEGIERVFSIFPILKLRSRQSAGTLSGGEKQMLALSNALVLLPHMLLIDEPSLGLSPPLARDALRSIEQMSQKSNIAVLIVEQKVREVLKIAQRVYVLRSGLVSFSGPTSHLDSDSKLREVYL